MATHTKNECALYKLGLCNQIHPEKHPECKEYLEPYIPKKSRIGTCVKRFDCDGCKQKLTGVPLHVVGSSGYTFCFQCCLQYCNGSRTYVFVNNGMAILSQNTVDKIRKELNLRYPEDIKNTSYIKH